VKRQSETATSAGVNGLVASNIRIVDPAETPTRPSSPKILLNLVLSLFTGLALGVGLAFFFDYLDKSVKTLDELEQVTAVPALGLIPAELPEVPRLMLVRESGPKGMRVKVVRSAPKAPVGRARIELISHVDAKSKLAEAFRELRTALLVSQPGGPPRSILIASTHPAEGKTVVATNLAITLAQLGRRVLLVDADLRKPRLHKVFGVPNTLGLSNYLSGAGPLRTQPVATAVPGLHLIPSGPVPPNPADLLDSDRLLQVQRDFAAQGFDHVIYDSPPILAVADPTILAGRSDAVVLVARAGTTVRDALAHAVNRLQQVKARVVGAVLNYVDLTESGYYGYSYKRYYGDVAAAAAPPERTERQPQERRAGPA